LYRAGAERSLLYIVHTSLNCVKQMKCKYLIYILTNYYRLRPTNERPPLVREGAPQRQDSNIQTTTFGQELISGHESQSGLDNTTY
jgi:hypothetical protein